MDHLALIEALRARLEDPLDFLARFCDEAGGRFEITDQEHEAGRYPIAAAHHSDLQAATGTQPDGARPLKLVLESDRITLEIHGPASLSPLTGPVGRTVVAEDPLAGDACAEARPMIALPIKSHHSQK